MDMCPNCGADRETERYAYGPGTEKVLCCDACREAVEADLYSKWGVQVAGLLCDATNGGDVAKMSAAFLDAFTRQHRYLQGEFFTFLWRFFDSYRKADFDARNEHAVKTAGRWYDTFFGAAK